MYPIIYIILYLNYPSVYIESVDPFMITVIDPCDEPDSLTSTTVVDQFYTITEDLIEFSFDPFITNPAWCSVTY